MLFKKPCYLALILVVLSIAATLAESDANSPSSSDYSAGKDQGESRRNMVVRCNYTSEGPWSCASCKDLLLCSHLNVGILAACVGNKKYCNEGFCSETRNPNCNTTSNSDRLRRRWTVGLSVSWRK